MEERRNHPRKKSDGLNVIVDGVGYPAVEWSFGGFLVEADPSRLSPGALVRIEGIAPAGREAEPVGIRARVVRAAAEGHLVALTCLHLDDAAYRLLGELRDA